MNSDAHIVENRKAPHSASGPAEFLRWLSAIRRDSVGSVVVVIEVPHGAVVEVLLERGFEVFSITGNGFTAFVAAIFQRAPKMMAEMFLSSPIRCVRTNIAFSGACQRSSDHRVA